MLSMLAAATVAGAAPEEVESRTVHTQALPDTFSGWEARFVEVRFPGGVVSSPHRHPGFVLGYVIDGAFRFAINGDDPRILRAGEAFYEPPGANHTVGESASNVRVARILAIIVAPVAKS